MNTTSRFLVLVALTIAGPHLLAGEAGSIELTVRETAGLRRFGYPIHVNVALPRAIDEGDRFRLLAGGKPIMAQVRKIGDRTIAIDWTASLPCFCLLDPAFMPGTHTRNPTLADSCGTMKAEPENERIQ